MDRKMKRSKVGRYEPIYDDLVIEILSYLPVQSLFRFKTVCKSWNNIISSPTFAKLHLKNYTNNNNNSSSDLCVLLWLDTVTNNWRLSMPTALLKPPTRELLLLSPSVDMGASSSFFGADKARMTGPVNGLICIYGMPLVCGVALCNPSLGGEMEFIPSCPISDPTFKGMIVRNIALGVDSTTKDVKIVQLLSYFQFRDDVATVAAQADVYTRRTRAWRRLEGGDVPDAFLRRCTVYGGEGGSSFAHWLHRGGGFLISFHMDDEVFSRTLLPETFIPRLFKTKVFPRGGSDGSSLVLLACPRLVQKEGLFQRWELVGGLGSQGRWTRLSSVDIGPTPMWATGSLLLMNKDEDFFYEYYSSHDYSNQEEEIIGDEVARRRRRTCCRYLKLVKYKGSLAF